MKRFKVTLKIRYQDAERTRAGVVQEKSYEQAARKLARTATYQAEADADPHGPPLSMKISIRELNPAPAKG